MKDITLRVNVYRECARHIWNSYYLDQLTKSTQFDIKDEFDELCTMLFSSLVLNPIGCEQHKKSLSNQANQEPLNCLLVSPSVKSGVPISINREIRRSAYWDHPLNFAKHGDLDMRFIDCFDSNVFGFRDFEYYVVRIVNSRKHKDLTGRDALIQTRYARIFFKE